MAILEEAYQEDQDVSTCMDVALKACKAFRGDTNFFDVAVVTQAGVRMGNRVPIADIMSFTKPSSPPVLPQ